MVYEIARRISRACARWVSAFVRFLKRLTTQGTTSSTDYQALKRPTRPWALVVQLGASAADGAVGTRASVTNSVSLGEAARTQGSAFEEAARGRGKGVGCLLTWPSA